MVFFSLLIFVLENMIIFQKNIVYINTEWVYYCYFLFGFFLLKCP